MHSFSSKRHYRL